MTALAIQDAGIPIAQDLMEVLRPLIAATRSPLSEYSLANLLLFRERHAYRFYETPIPHVRGITYDGERHALPLAQLDADACAALLRHVDCIGPQGNDAPALAEALDLRCDWRDADSDYVYEASRMAILAGAKAKRAQARTFEREHQPIALPIGAHTIPLAETALEGWRCDVGRDDEDTDHRECREALHLHDVLDLEGLIVTVRGEPVAFLLGGPGADGSRIVHFAKGRRAFSASYPWMFARYAADIGAGRINFEQDLGKPGFAQAKRGFAPITQLRKYRLRHR